MNAYPHFCRDEHEEIGFSGDGEQCPVCKWANVALDAKADRDRLAAAVERLMHGSADDHDTFVEQREHAIQRAEQAEAEVTRLTKRWEALRGGIDDLDIGPSMLSDFTLNEVRRVMRELEAQR